MRAAVFVLALLVVGSNAFLLDSLNDTFAPHIETLKQAGSQLLSGLVAKGKEVLGALLSKASDAVSQFTTPAIGRRSLLGDKLKQWWTKAQAFNQEVMSKMEGQKHVSGNLFSGALNKLKALYNKLKANKAAFKGADDFSKAVDDVVDEHADMQKRFLFSLKDVQDAASSAFDVAKDIATSDAAKALAAQAAQAALAAAIGGKREDKRFLVSFDDIKAAAGSALSAAKDLATSDAAKALAAQAAQAALAAAIGKREDKRFLVSFDDIKAAAGSALNAAKDLATSDAAKALAAQAAQAALAAAIGKRTVLSDIGDFFAPHINTLKDAVSGVGSTLKGHATNLWNAVKGSVTDLGTKLSGHVDKLKEHGSTLLDHGKNALDALKGAVGDILSQTLQNIAPAIKGVISTGTDAAGVVSGHIAGAVGGDAAASGSF